MKKYNIYAHDVGCRTNKFVTSLSANTIDELNKAYGLKLFRDGNSAIYISLLSYREIVCFFKKYNIAFDLKIYRFGLYLYLFVNVE